ncbi:hypothetical protein LTR56_016467 [Elasticomyces elasticus]|nr:hypothetical protein LTR56_016467 [Elasticomyces elasticus]KAK3633474.1 hypothetical protein LTR22_020094 [Elasticomyces elasticus]
MPHLSSDTLQVDSVRAFADYFWGFSVGGKGYTKLSLDCASDVEWRCISNGDGIRFPTKDNLYTRFATELVLPRDENAGVKVSIIPGSDRDDHDNQRLSESSHEVDLNNPDIGGVIEEAKQVMGLSQTKVFSSDVLLIEFQGVNQPHLTPVDLPGLFRAGNRDQSEHEAPIVHQMVRSYM